MAEQEEAGPPTLHRFATHSLDPDSVFYRSVVGGCSGALLLVALGMLAFIGPRKYRRLNEHAKAAAMAHLALAVCSCLLSLTAAALRLLGRQLLYTTLSTFLACTQAVDGVYTWERYLLTHPDDRPTWVVRTVIHLYIVVLLFLPFTMTWVWYALDPGDGPHKYKDIHVSDPSPTTVAFLLCLTLYTAAIPARILWDVGFGCSMITRIHELREQATAAVDTEKNAALLALTRRTILYIVVSGLLNLFIHIPQLKIIPFDPVFCCLFNLSFGILTHFCYSSGGADASTYVGWTAIRAEWVAALSFPFTRSAGTAPINTPGTGNLVSPGLPTRAPSAFKASDGFMSIPDPYAGGAHPRPPLPSIFEAQAGGGGGGGDGGGAVEEAGGDGGVDDEGQRSRPETYIQDRDHNPSDGSSLPAAAASPSSSSSSASEAASGGAAAAAVEEG